MFRMYASTTDELIIPKICGSRASMILRSSEGQSQVTSKMKVITEDTVVVAALVAAQT